MITFGVFSLLLGFTLLGLGIIRLFLSRSRGHAWQIPAILSTLGVILVAGGFFLLESGKGQGGGVVAIGSLLTIVGFLVMLAGTWYSFWGPVRTGLTGTSLHFFLFGILLFIIGILIIVLPLGETQFGSSGQWYWPFLYSSKHLGPIPYPILVLILFLVGNGLGIRNGLRFSQLIGANLLFIALAIALYFTLPY